ncbi:MAG: hypothetical protein M1827_000022 [Pycnora praestabilis]|nr:MAG: hypothetical protein M1827_000022 [Pycnora praestabilis]
MKVLLCGGLAGVVTWTSVFPLDVIKTRVQMQPNSGAGLSSPTTEQGPLLGGSSQPGNVGHRKTLGAISIARQAYQSEGIRVFFHGIGVCSLRAFIVNAIQWAVYEWIMQETRPA